MRILHFSDNHGKVPILHGNYDLIICSGDFLPNFEHIWNNNKVKEAECQLNFLISKAAEFKNVFNNKKFLFVGGNHDILCSQMIVKVLIDAGIDAIDLTNKKYTVNGYNFYGFPYIPFINGVWNYECFPATMLKKVDEMASVLNSIKTDAVVAHSAIYGYLNASVDAFGVIQTYGSTEIANMFDYKIEKDMVPDFYLHGHIHGDYGIAVKDNMVISNAATTQNILELK